MSSAVDAEMLGAPWPAELMQLFNRNATLPGGEGGKTTKSEQSAVQGVPAAPCGSCCTWTALQPAQLQAAQAGRPPRRANHSRASARPAPQRAAAVQARAWAGRGRRATGWRRRSAAWTRRCWATWTLGTMEPWVRRQGGPCLLKLWGCCCCFQCSAVPCLAHNLAGQGTIGSSRSCRYSINSPGHCAEPLPFTAHHCLLLCRTADANYGYGDLPLPDGPEAGWLGGGEGGEGEGGARAAEANPFRARRAASRRGISEGTEDIETERWAEGGAAARFGWRVGGWGG